MTDSFDNLYPKIKDPLRSAKLEFKELLRRVTGVSIPIFGLSWNPPASEREIVRKLFDFIEDRRVLYYPDFLERVEWCNESILQIRRELTKCIQEVEDSSKATYHLKAMRSACRQYLDRYKPDDTSPLVQNFLKKLYEVDIATSSHASEFFMALGELRATFGIHIAELCVMYGLDLEGEITSILPREVDEDKKSL